MSSTSDNIIPIDFINAVSIPVSIWDAEKQIEVYNNMAFQNEFPKGLTWQGLNSSIHTSGSSTFEIKKKTEGKHIVFTLIPKESIEEFVSLASHDLKEPLRKINTFGERLEKSIKEKSDKSELFLDRMMDASQRMNSMLDSLLTYSRIHKTEKPSSFDIKKEIVANTNQHTLSTTWESNWGKTELTLEKEAFLRAVNELISNADKFSPEEKALHIVANKTDNYLEISFEDKGIGISENQFMKVTKPFVKLNGRSAFPGNGMGLAIADKICSIYGGTLGFETKENGVKAIITWPLS